MTSKGLRTEAARAGWSRRLH